MSFNNYAEKKKQVIEILNGVKDKAGNDDLMEFIENKIKKVEDDRFIISIFGNYSNGKSSFLNALMGFGEEVLIEDELASTAAITRLKAPSTAELVNKAEVTFSDRSKKIIDLSELENYSARNKNYEVEANIKEVTIYLDSEYLNNGVEIVDTPGFNSTYTVHTEIAKSHVDKSDASIFMFSYDKPGSEEEFNFLYYVNNYMDRIFFVLNKIDKCDKTENSIEGTVAALRDKLLMKNVAIDGKEIYPVSAKLAKEAIKENFEAKMVYSRFEEFKESLADYLTSDENLKDRLFAPLNAVLSKLKLKSDMTQESIAAASKDNEELLKELESKKKIINECEKDIKEKRTNLRASVRNIIRNAKNSIGNGTDKIADEVKEELSEIESEFDMALKNFSGMTVGVYDKFIKNWNKIKGDLEEELLKIIEENVDDEEDLLKVEKRIMNIIHANLNIERVDIEDPKADFKDLDNMEKEIEKRKNEFDGIREKLASCRNDKKKLDCLTEEKQKLQKEIDQLNDSKNMRLESLGEPKPFLGVRNVQVKQEREGFFGKMGNALFGPKVVSKQENYVDHTMEEYILKQQENIRREYTLEVSAQRKMLEQRASEIFILGDVENKIAEAELDSKDARKRYINTLDKMEEEKKKIASTIVRVSRDNYFKEVRNACDEYSKTINDFLDDKKDLIGVIMNGVLDSEVQRLEAMKQSLDRITSITNKTPEEIQSEIKDLYTMLENINQSRIEIQKFKERVL